MTRLAPEWCSESINNLQSRLHTCHARQKPTQLHGCCADDDHAAENCRDAHFSPDNKTYHFNRLLNTVLDHFQIKINTDTYRTISTETPKHVLLFDNSREVFKFVKIQQNFTKLEVKVLHPMHLFVDFAGFVYIHMLYSFAGLYSYAPHHSPHEYEPILHHAARSTSLRILTAITTFPRRNINLRLNI